MIELLFKDTGLLLHYRFIPSAIAFLALGVTAISIYLGRKK